nr:class I SAM-dependent methyltransferase [Qipengyuania huizhouensis]
MAEIEGSHWWFVGRRAILEALIKHRIRPDRSSRILEAGCGTGGNLALLRQFGTVEAFEFDAQAREIASRKSCIDVQAGSLPDGIEHLSGPYQLIALFDVLEHLDRDEDSLRSLRRLLAKDGKLILTVPALQFLWSQHDVLHHHRRRYSGRRLQDVLERAELQVNYMSYFNSLLLPAAVVQRLASRFGKSEVSLDGVPPKIANTILGRIFAVERRILRHARLPIGLSLCAICSAR